MGARSDAPKYPRTLLTHREEDNRVWRGKDAGKGAIVIFRRLAGGDEDELLALRVLLVDLVAIFLKQVSSFCVTSQD